MDRENSVGKGTEFGKTRLMGNSSVLLKKRIINAINSEIKLEKLGMVHECQVTGFGLYSVSMREPLIVFEQGI